MWIPAVVGSMKCQLTKTFLLMKQKSRPDFIKTNCGSGLVLGLDLAQQFVCLCVCGCCCWPESDRAIFPSSPQSCCSWGQPDLAAGPWGALGQGQNVGTGDTSPPKLPAGQRAVQSFGSRQSPRHIGFGTGPLPALLPNYFCTPSLPWTGLGFRVSSFSSNPKPHKGQ